MIGAIIGDIVGSRFEFKNHRSTDFDLFHPECDFTDDSVLTIALAESIMTGAPYEKLLKEYAVKYPDKGYGGSFKRWVASESYDPYDSWGNGSAMRTSPVGWAFDDPDQVLAKAGEYAAVTHNHPEGIKGAQATAIAIWMARTGSSKDEIKAYIKSSFDYNLDLGCDMIRPFYTFNESCAQTVPQAITAFLESTDFESAIRLAVSLGGDTDTLTCITGGIAEAFYKKIPTSYMLRATQIIAEQSDSLIDVVENFIQKYVDERIVI